MTRTNALTRSVINFLYYEGAFAFRVSDTGVFDVKRNLFRAASKKGISDILAVYNGKFIAVEIKVGIDSLRPEQIGFIKNVEHCGGIAVVVGSLPEFKKAWLAIKGKI